MADLMMDTLDLFPCVLLCSTLPTFNQQLRDLLWGVEIFDRPRSSFITVV